MDVKRIFTLTALAVAVVITVTVEAAPRRGKRDEGARPQISEEARKLAAVCRRDPSEANRDALKRQIGADYDRFLEQLRAKLKSGKHDRKSQEARRRLEAMTRDRDKRVEQIMRRMLEPQERPAERPGKDRKPRKRD